MSEFGAHEPLPNEGNGDANNHTSETAEQVAGPCHAGPGLHSAHQVRHVLSPGDCTGHPKKSAKNDGPGFRALVLLGLAVAFHAAITPHMTKSSVTVMCKSSATAEASHPVAVVPPQWLPVFLASAPASQPPPPSPSPTMTDLTAASLPEGFSVAHFASARAPRGMLIVESGDLLVVETRFREWTYTSRPSCVSALWDDDGDGVSGPNERACIASSANGLTHGLAVSGGYLFASSDSTVFRWPYAGTERADLGPHTVVVQNIVARRTFSHITRTLVFDAAGLLYVSVGSLHNVDDDSFRSRIRRFGGVTAADAQPAEFVDGEVWADGLRNSVGLAFDADGTLWGVENGADNLFRDDVGGDVHNDNPGEELNRLDRGGGFYGYPYCWSEFALPAQHARGRTTQWVWPESTRGRNFMSTHSDEWCRNTTHVIPPVMVMQAHTAPLGITFFGTRQVGLSSPPPCTAEAVEVGSNGGGGGGGSGGGGAFPCDWVGDAFVSQHGSWNRDVPVGYAVVRLPFSSASGGPSGEVVSLLAHGGQGAKWPSGFRPTDVQFDRQGRLLVSSDKSDEIVRISYSYAPPPPPPSPPCTPNPNPTCTKEKVPVCGMDGITYGNKCLADAACQFDAILGKCCKDKKSKCKAKKCNKPKAFKKDCQATCAAYCLEDNESKKCPMDKENKKCNPPKGKPVDCTNKKAARLCPMSCPVCVLPDVE